jgi:hypothetical protein
MAKFEVQEFCLMGGWTNTWSFEDEDGETVPSFFDTEAEAQAELDWFLKEMQEAVDEGNMQDVPDREDFRIVEVE